MVSEGFQCGGRASEVRKGGDGNQDTVGKAPWAGYNRKAEDGEIERNAVDSRRTLV